MRAKDLDHLRDLIKQAEAGQLSRSEMVALLILVRGEAPPTSMLRDLGHTVAHDDRDRGFAVDYLSKFVDSVADAAEHGGVIEVTVLFEIRAVLRELSVLLNRLGVKHHRKAMLAHAETFAHAVADVIAGTQMRVARPGATVQFINEPRPVVVIDFGDNPPAAGVLQWHKGVGLAVPLLLNHR